MALVSHGGLLSLTEAAAAGVPALALPVLGDQFGNAAQARGAALRLAELGAPGLRAALRHVLSDAYVAMLNDKLGQTFPSRRNGRTKFYEMWNRENLYPGLILRLFIIVSIKCILYTQDFEIRLRN